MTKVLMCTMMQDYMRKDPEAASILFAFKLAMVQIFHPLPHLSRSGFADTAPVSPAQSGVKDMWGGTGDDTTPGCEGRKKVLDTIRSTKALSTRNAEEAKRGNVVGLGKAGSGNGVARESAPDDAHARHGTRALGDKMLMDGTEVDSEKRLRLVSHEEATRETGQEKDDVKQESEYFRTHLSSTEKKEKERHQDRDHGSIDSMRTQAILDKEEARELVNELRSSLEISEREHAKARSAFARYQLSPSNTYSLLSPLHISHAALSACLPHLVC